MKSLTRLAATVCLLALLASAGCGVGSTRADNKRMFNRVADYDAHMMVDDLMLFSQTHRPFRGSRWVIQ